LNGHFYASFSSSAFRRDEKDGRIFLTKNKRGFTKYLTLANTPEKTPHSVKNRHEKNFKKALFV
jgi:hypothetical protein